MIGRTVSHYHITSQLGAGGMGVVYAAEDTHLGRTVALKLLRPELTRDETAKKRFITEARAASSLQHRNICNVHDVDETPEGQLFLVMDCYDGETLRRRIDRGPLPLDEALDITRQVADGLARAHAAGMVHRDIKPANIMITGEGEVKILDFGLAKLAGKTKVTKTGTTLGTAAYMSPEQTRGEEVDASSDVWSVGVMLYEMLARQRPFVGEHDLAVAYGIVNNTQAPITTFRGDVPAGVVSLIDRCLAKNPKERFADAGSLREALDDREEAQRKVRKRPIRGAVVAMIAVAVAAFVVFTNVDRFTGGEAEAQEHALAIVDFTNRGGTDGDNVALTMTSLVNVGLVERSPIRVISPTYVHEIRRRLFGEATEHIAESQALEIARVCDATQLVWGEVIHVNNDPQVTWHLIDVASGRSIAAKRLEAGNLIECADALVAEVVPLVAGQAGVEPPQDIKSVGDMVTRSPEALQHFLDGVRAINNFEDARPHFRQAIRVDSTFALAYAELSRMFFGTASHRYTDIDSSVYFARRAWNLRSRLGLKDRLLLEARLAEAELRLHDAMALWGELHQRWPDDEWVLERHVRLMHWESYPLSLFAALSCRGWELYPDNTQLGLFCELGQPTPERRLQGAHRLTRRLPHWANAWDELGLRYLEMGMPDSAEAAFHQALAVDPEFYSSQEGLIFCAHYRGQIDSALVMMEAFIARWAESASDSVTVICPYYIDHGTLGLLLMEKGQYGRATAILEALHDRLRPNRMVAYRLIHGRARVALGMHRYQDVLDRIDEWPHTQGDALGIYLNCYRASTLVRLGRIEEAKSAVDALTGTLDAAYLEDDLYALIPSAEIALAEGNPERAIAFIDEMKRWGNASEGWMQQESAHIRARACAAAGRHQEGIDTLKDLLRIRSGHALGHYELAKIYQDLGRSDEARIELTTFLEMWKDADEDMPQLIDARERLVRLEAGEV